MASKSDSLNDDSQARLHLARSCIALFVLRWANSSFDKPPDYDQHSHPSLQLHRRLLRLLDWIDWLLEEVRWSDHWNSYSNAVRLLVGRWCDGSVAHRRVLREGEGGRRRVLPAVDFGGFLELLPLPIEFTNLFYFFAAPSWQHSHFLRLVVHFGLGWSGLVPDRRHPLVRIGCVLAKRTREGGAAELAILDACVPPEAAPIPVRWISATPDVSCSLLPRIPVRTVQLLNDRRTLERISMLSGNWRDYSRQ